MKKLFLISLLFASTALAEDKQEPTELVEEKAETTRRYLPGEEVVTPTGKKLKVWSTEGPVSVSKTPEPFADKGKDLNDVHIVVDAEKRKPRHDR